MNAKSPMMVIKEYFGYKRDELSGHTQTLQEFAAEVKCLTEEEKNALATGISNGSFTY